MLPKLTVLIERIAMLNISAIFECNSVHFRPYTFFLYTILTFYLLFDFYFDTFSDETRACLPLVQLASLTVIYPVSSKW